MFYLLKPIARLGAFVIGLEPVEESMKIAQLHLAEDPDLLQRVKYIAGKITMFLHALMFPFNYFVYIAIATKINNYVFSMLPINNIYQYRFIAIHCKHVSISSRL